MHRFSPFCFALGLMIGVAIFALDQWSKQVLLTSDLAQHPINLTSFLSFVMVWNHGISFGLLSRFDERLFLIGMTGAISLSLLVWMATTRSLLTAAALGSILGGAIGNIVDRVRLGAVADFFDFHLGSYHWPAFNFADSFIFIGVVVLFGRSMFSKKPDSLKDISS